MSTKIKDYIEKKEKEFQQASRDLVILKNLASRYPDLEIKLNRWSNEFFVSKSSNSKVTHAWFGFGCGCCEDSPFYVYPYLIDYNSGIQIYSDPFQICIGEKSLYCGLNIDHGWEDKLRGHGIPEEIIEKTRVYIEENTWSNDDEDDEYE